MRCAHLWGFTARLAAGKATTRLRKHRLWSETQDFVVSDQCGRSCAASGASPGDTAKLRPCHGQSAAEVLQSEGALWKLAFFNQRKLEKLEKRKDNSFKDRGFRARRFKDRGSRARSLNRQQLQGQRLQSQEVQRQRLQSQKPKQTTADTEPTQSQHRADTEPTQSRHVPAHLSRKLQEGDCDPPFSSVTPLVPYMYNFVLVAVVRQCGARTYGDSRQD